MNDSTRAPTAEGNFAKTPFAHLVLYLYQHRSDGTLLVGSAGAAAEGGIEQKTATRVLFRRGRAVAARFRDGARSLDAGLLPLCDVHDAAFAFYGEDLVGSGAQVTTGMFDPHAFVMSAVRRYPRPDVVDEVLSRFDGMRIRLQFGTDVDRLRLERNEAKLIDVLRAGPTDIETLCSDSELSRADARSLIYVLIVTKIASAYEEPVSALAKPAKAIGPSPTAHSSSKPPGGVAAPAAAKSSPRPRDTGSESVQGIVLPDSQAQASTWAKLANRAGQASLRPPSGTGASTQGMAAVRPTSLSPPRASMPPIEALDAAGKLKRVEQLFQRSAYNEALVVIRVLVAEDAASAKYQALLGFALLMRTTEGVSKEIIDAVNAALRIDEDEPRALFTKALSYKRMGKEREAMHYFKRVVAVDPGHIEAAREMRLLGIRAAAEEKADAKKPKR